LHEWKGFISKDALNENLITWIFEEDSFSPIAKVKGNKYYSILADHLGTPIEMYQDDGSLFWERELNANGKVLKETQKGSCPFLFQGQYYDAEIELAYNRFRYYDPEDGRYISQDPIGLLSKELGFYNYVDDSNNFTDVFGLAKQKGQAGSYSTVGGHHVHAKAGFKKNKKYSKYKAFCLGHDFMKIKNLDHDAMTAKQRELFKELHESGRPNTLSEHTRIATESLQAGGASKQEARDLVAQSLKNLRKQGVTNPSNIPWY